MIDKNAYRCTEIATSPDHYGLTTYYLQRADGVAGHAVITSPDEIWKALKPGKVYRIPAPEEIAATR